MWLVRILLLTGQFVWIGHFKGLMTQWRLSEARIGEHYRFQRQYSIIWFFRPEMLWPLLGILENLQFLHVIMAILAENYQSYTTQCDPCSPETWDTRVNNKSNDKTFPPNESRNILRRWITSIKLLSWGWDWNLKKRIYDQEGFHENTNRFGSA